MENRNMDVSSLIELKKNPKIPELAPGDTVKVSARIVEGGKERIQVFQGVVIKIRRGGASASFTVRHVAYGIGVERTFPVYSPLVEKVEIVRHGKVRRSKLYYLRGLSGKEARRKIKRVEKKAAAISEELLETEPEEELAPEDVVQEEGEAVEEGQEPVAETTAAEEGMVEEKPAAEAPEAVKEEEPAAVEAEEPQAEVEEEAKAEAVEAPAAEEAETKAEAVTEEPEAATETPVAEEEAEPAPEEEEKPTAEAPEEEPVMEKEEEAAAEEEKPAE
jgi:large subunit ribosomal protein L19